MVSDLAPPIRPSGSAPRLAVGPRTHGLAADELVKLHHALIEALPSGRGIIAQLVAPEPNKAIVQVAYDLAYISASWLEKRVLYVNSTDIRTDPDERSPFGQAGFDFLRQFDSDDLEGSISRVVGLELYEMTLPSMRGAPDLTPVLRRIPELMERLRCTFDLVVIASPSASEAPMGVLLSRYVDGNVLVLEAGSIRATEAALLRDSLRSSGGSVVGVVLTRCRSYAPRWLSRWL
jgi:protein-tyrosine kinase